MRERCYDLGLWLVLCAAPLAYAAASLDGRALWVALAALPLLGAAALLSRRLPLAALAVPVVLSLATTVEMAAPAYLPALAVLAYLCGRRLDRARPALWFFAAVTAAGLPLALALTHDLWPWFSQLATLLFAVVLPWLLGRYRRQYAELVAAGWRLAERMEDEQQAVADRTRLRERARIAGDMHDSLGHDLTLIALRAGALEVDPRLDAAQQAAIGELRQAAGAATERLREIVGVLREDGAPAPRTPSGAQESVTALVAGARASGLAVSFADAGAAEADLVRGLPPMAAAAVHRLVQEGLTNAAKHAPGAAVEVRLAREAEGELSVCVVNGPPPGEGPLPGLASGGSGLVGLEERVRLAGGELRTGAIPEGGFALTARLPTAADAAPRTAPYRQQTTSARELARAQQQVRRRLVHTVAVPLALTAALLLLMGGFALVSNAWPVLERETYDRMAVGQTRASVEALLPYFDLDDLGELPDAAPPAPHGQDCRYYRTAPYGDSAYRLCFHGDRLASKEVLAEHDG